MFQRPPRLLLCRPQAGLTDMFGVIGRCIHYADRFNRTIIVEMDYEGSLHFRDDLSKYFVSHDKNILLSSKGFSEKLDGLSAFPKTVTGRVNSYEAKYSETVDNYFVELDGNLLSFNLKQDYDEPLLLLHAAGGTVQNAERILRRISLTRLVQDELKARMAILGETYTSLHIRYTDFITDFQERVELLGKEIKGPIFLATDNPKALDFCQNIFGKDRVFNFTTFPKTAGKAIHSDLEMDARTSNVDAICDLVMLAAAQKYYYFPLSKKQKTWTVYSGYSELAQMLHTDKALFGQFTGQVPFDLKAKIRLKLHKLRRRFKGMVLKIVAPLNRR